MRSSRYSWTKIVLVAATGTSSRVFSPDMQAARLITFLTTLWVLALKLPTQKCVPHETFGLCIYTREFVNMRYHSCHFPLPPNPAESRAWDEALLKQTSFFIENASHLFISRSSLVAVTLSCSIQVC
jgi:hypothetical protein